MLFLIFIEKQLCCRDAILSDWPFFPALLCFIKSSNQQIVSPNNLGS